MFQFLFQLCSCFSFCFRGPFSDAEKTKSKTVVQLMFRSAVLVIKVVSTNYRKCKQNDIEMPHRRK